MPLIVTRPQAAGQALAAELAAAGLTTLWLPAFDLLPAADQAITRATLARLADFDLAVFVSPAAVRFAVAELSAAWPAPTAIAAVGSGTARAVQALVPAVAAARLIEPRTASAAEPGAQGAAGSEALWQALQDAALQPRAALVLRAEHGRDWLAQRLQQAGAAVTTLAVYRRLPHVPAASARRWLLAQGDVARWDSVLTSSEAVDVLLDQVQAVPGAAARLRAGCALASHARIAARLSAAGFVDVRVCAPEAAAIGAALAAAAGSR